MCFCLVDDLNDNAYGFFTDDFFKFPVDFFQFKLKFEQKIIFVDVDNLQTDGIGFDKVRKLLDIVF